MIRLLCIPILLAFTASADANIVFVFDNNTTTIGGGLDNLATGSFTQSGVQITATSFVANEASVFNSTANGFGINQTGSGDETAAFDNAGANAGENAEGLDLSFDTSLQLVEIDVDSFSVINGDEITISIGGTTVATVTSTGTTSLGNFAYSANDIIEIRTTGGDYGSGWNFVSITVTPEPSSLFLCLQLAGVVAYRRRR